MSRAETNPRTGKRYTFPRDLSRYLGSLRLMYANDAAQPCEHGHFDCAVWDGGPCSAELRAAYLRGDDR